MPNAIEQLRTQTEADLAKLLQRHAPEHRKAIEAAIERYGSVQAIPPSFWEGLKRDIDSDAAALMLILLMGVYKTNVRRIGRTGTPEQRRATQALVGDDDALRRQASTAAAVIGRQVADEYVDAARDRIVRNIDEKAEELARMPDRERARKAREEINSATGAEAGESTATTNTTKGVTVGQGSASDDVGRTLGVTVGTVWVTERDAKVCPICRPLHNQPVDKWDEVLAGSIDGQRATPYIVANGGPPAHPNCRCSLRHYIDNASEN